MPEDIKNPAAGEGSDKDLNAGEGQQEGADDKEKTNSTEDGKEDAGDGEGEGEGDKGADNKGEDKAKAPEEKETPKVNDEDQEPATRKRLSKQDFIIGRQHKKLSKTAKADEKGEDDKGNENTGEDDDEVAPEDEALITKVVAKKFAPIIDKSLAADDNEEISGFLKDNPDFKPFEAKARRFMQHPSRRQLPIKSIFYEVAGDSLIKIGADRQKAADAKAKGSQTGGGSNRANEGAKNDWGLSKEEFEAKQEKIRRGQL